MALELSRSLVSLRILKPQGEVSVAMRTYENQTLARLRATVTPDAAAAETPQKARDMRQPPPCQMTAPQRVIYSNK